MQTILEILLVMAVFLSIIPVIKMLKNRNDRNYGCLKILIFSTFFWTILIVLERISTNTFIIYYSGMLGFVLRLLFAILMLCTIYQYVGKVFPKYLILLFSSLIFVDLIIALTNSQTLWFLELKRSELITFNDLYQSNYGSLFIFHLLLSYMIAISAIVLLFVFLSKKRGIRQYSEITRTMAVSTFLVLLFNGLQFLFLDLNINLTYISLVIVAYVLYDIIYRKDMVFNLRTSGRSEILANMREMYILTDSNHKIVEISPMMLEKYDLSLDEVISKSFDYVAEKIADKVTFYSEYNMNEEAYEQKDHYHLRKKQFKLKGMNESGNMILLYDETQVYNLLRELNKLSNYDAMTGLNNRNYFESKLNNINNTDRIGILSLDLNGLKINNDYLGHERGDFLLKSIANKMKEIFKDIDEKDMARIGGDEFIVLIYNTDKKTVEKKKQELLDVCENKDIEKTISISVGAAYGDGETSIYNLIQSADALMYEMKVEASKIYREKIIEYIKLQNKYIR